MLTDREMRIIPARETGLSLRLKPTDRIGGCGKSLKLQQQPTDRTPSAAIVANWNEEFLIHLSALLRSEKSAR